MDTPPREQAEPADEILVVGEVSEAGVTDGDNSEISIVREVSEAGVTVRERRGVTANMNELGQRQLGLIMFAVVTALVLAMLLFVVIYAWLTYPTTDEIQQLLGDANQDDPLAAASQAREQWSNGVEHVAQLFIFGSLVPLLATIVGYVLGERTARLDSE